MKSVKAYAFEVAFLGEFWTWGWGEGGWIRGKQKVSRCFEREAGDEMEWLLGEEEVVFIELGGFHLFYCHVEGFEPCFVLQGGGLVDS